MKTKLFITILASLPLVAGLTGCKSEEEINAKPAKEILIVEGGDIVIPASDPNNNVLGSSVTKEVNIIADCAWTVNIEKNYDVDQSVGSAVSYGSSFSVQPMKGKGNGTIVVTSDQNSFLTERSGEILLTSDGGLKQRINVRQTSSNPSITLSEQNIILKSDEHSHTLTIISNSYWNIEGANTDWLEFFPNNGGPGSTVVVIQTPSNIDDVERSAKVIIDYSNNTGDVRAFLTITQEAMAEPISLNVSPKELPIFSPKGGSQKVTVKSNAAWRAFVPSSVKDWLHIYPEEGGVKDNEIIVTCDEHLDTTSDRMTVLIVIAGTKDPQQADVIIQQSAAEVVETPGENDNPDPILSRKQ